jgi:hypothetical protein
MAELEREIRLDVLNLLERNLALCYCCKRKVDDKSGQELPKPVLLPAEVLKIGVTHTFSHAKAARELGYAPRVRQKEGVEAAARVCLLRRLQTGGWEA